MSDAFSLEQRFDATLEVFSRARRRVSVEDVRRHAPDDPGYAGYVAAFEAILERGVAALNDSFDITETIGLTRWTRPKEPEASFLWFRLLTATAELLLSYGEWRNYSLVTLLSDTLALSEDPQAPTELLSAVCREVAREPYLDPAEAAFCILGELLMAHDDGLDEPAIAQLCEALEGRHEQWCEPGDAFVWDLTVFDQLHRSWIELVSARFPTNPPKAAELKQRLLDDGCLWED